MPVPKCDLILLHAPSVYDFRKRSTLFGPISDVVPSTQIFEMYPIGFMTILEHLGRHGLSVRIINVALRMLLRRSFDAEKLLTSLKPLAFGLDLHWLAHAQGSLELAKIIKRVHPQIPVIFGGLSASYFHEELIRYPQVDYVIRGDSAEEPLRLLVEAIKEGRPLQQVPNLTWKNGPEVVVNALSHVPADLDGVSFSYRSIMKSCARHRDILGHLPFKVWFRYPILAALSVRGCIHNCVLCGGSAEAYWRICGRARPAYRKPELMAQDIGTIARYIRAPMIILGDIMQAGDKYVENLLAALKKQNLKNHVALEFFLPPGRKMLEMVAASIPKFNLQISPESHDEDVRRSFGRSYSNDQLEKSIEDALDVGCRRVDVFFMIGLPGQTRHSVVETVRYCGELLRRFGGPGRHGRLHPYISPLAPFLDPGSRAFEEPEKYGYTLFYRTLEEHRKALLAPSWKETLNYETTWMTRADIVDVTYEAALELNSLKREYGLIGRREGKRIAEMIERERLLLREIDSITASHDGDEGDQLLQELMKSHSSTGPSTICKKDEMNWPSARVRFNVIRIARGLLTRSRET